MIISLILNFCHAFWTHPPNFPQMCSLVSFYILVPLFILDHPPQTRYFGLHGTKIKSAQKGPTHQIFPKSIVKYLTAFSSKVLFSKHLHFSTVTLFWTTHLTQGTKYYKILKSNIPKKDPPTK